MYPETTFRSIYQFSCKSVAIGNSTNCIRAARNQGRPSLPEPMKHAPSVSEKHVSKSLRKSFLTRFSGKFCHFMRKNFWWPFFSHWPLFFASPAVNFLFTLLFPLSCSISSLFFLFLLIFHRFLHCLFFPLKKLTFPSPKLTKTFRSPLKFQISPLKWEWWRFLLYSPHGWTPLN